LRARRSYERENKCNRHQIMDQAHKRIVLYLGVIGSICSIIALVYMFFPSTQGGNQSIQNATGVNIGNSTNSKVHVDIKK
jgi:hypothetical protein